MKIHDEIEDWMAGALCDALTPDEQKNFEQHLAECPHCRSLYEETKKMNEMLNTTLPELRPDPNFERRVIAGFREKIAGSGLHPWRGLVWFLRFRTVQTALALIVLAAMVKGGAMLTGERFPRHTASNSMGMTAFGPDGSDADAFADTNSIPEDSGAGVSYTPPTLGTQVVVVSHHADVARAKQAMTQGDKALKEKRYDVAVVEYQSACDNLPEAPATHELRAKAIDAFSNASVRLAEQRIVEGRFADAASVAKTVLDPNYNPTYQPAIALAAHLEDPDYYNKTVGPKLANRVQEVQSLFNEAKEFYDSGRYDLAYKRYDQILNLDPYNIAARKGQETVVAAKAKYADEAYNTTRGNLSWQLDSKWEIAPRKYEGHEVASAGSTYTGSTTLSSGVWDNQNTSIQGDLGVSFQGVNAPPSLPEIPPSSPPAVGQITSGLRSGSEAISGNAIDALLAGTSNMNTVNQGVSKDGKDGGPTSGDKDKLYSHVDGLFYSGTAPRTQNMQLAQNQGQAVPATHSFNPVSQVAADSGSATHGVATGTPVPVDSSKLIRNATLDFEIPSFEKALDTITAVAREEQGYVDTQNSDSGPNGKLQGEIVVKVLPANLDRFLLKLRALGDLKNQTISTEDVTKDYYDTQSRIRNSQITEQSLIDMLKKNTGKVSDLLQVEKEMSRVRGEIEKMQGQLKYYDALVQYATVTITLHEKDINQTAAYLLRENAQLSLFAKDVEKAFADAKSEAEAAKAQMLESHVERDVNGRVVATLHLLLPPESSEEAIDKLKAIGRIQNFNAQTQRVARDGSAASDTAKVERDKVELNLVIQRDEENAVQGTNISVLTDKVEEKTAQIKQAAATAGVDVKGAEFSRAQNGVEVSTLLLRMPVKKYPAFLEQIKSLGTVKGFTVTRREDATATEDAPAEVSLQIFSQPSIVTEQGGLWASIRGTLGEGFSALMWSARMIGVSIAFVLPWALAIGVVVWLLARRRRLAKK